MLCALNIDADWLMHLTNAQSIPVCINTFNVSHNAALLHEQISLLSAFIKNLSGGRLCTYCAISQSACQFPVVLLG